MPGPGFTQLFGGDNIYQANPSFLLLDPFTANLALSWPIEQSFATPNVANIIQVNATAPGLAISFADARQTTNGYTALFNNTGANAFEVRDQSGATLMSVGSGQQWQIYLQDNSTANGVWRIFQYGAGVSNANAAALAGAGLQAVNTFLQEFTQVVSHPVDYIVVDADRAKVQQWTGGTGTFTLPDPTTLSQPNGWFTYIKNTGSGNLLLDAPGVFTVDGQSTLTFAPQDSAIILTDGAEYYTLGFSSGGIGSGFNYIIINVGGAAGDFVLSGAQLNQIGYRFTGVLTGNRRIVVPSTAQEYWVDNETTGAFTLAVATAPQVTPIMVPQGVQVILFCDGTNVLNANSSSSISFPISIANGGTGATTAPSALTALGGTALGQLVFTAPSIAAAQADLAVPPNSRQIATGLNLTGGGDLSADRTIKYALVGACATSAADQNGLGSGGGVRVAWGSETYDNGGWHDNVTNNSRLTVPAGVAFARFTAQISCESSTSAPTSAGLVLEIDKNGGNFTQVVLAWANTSGINAEMGGVVTTGIIPVVPGDFFEVFITPSLVGGGLINARTNTRKGSFTAEAIA